MQPQPRSFIDSLTSIRFFAALWVVLLHYGEGFLKGAPDFLWWFGRHGQKGVALFFILSGFVLGYNYLEKAAKGALDFRDFMLARFARIYPVYILSMLLHIPFALKETKDVVGGTGAAAIVMLSALPLIVLTLQSWWPKLLYASHWNTPSWSISNEMFFYACFPKLAKAASGFGLKKVAIWSAICVLLVLSFFWLYAVANPDRLGNVEPNVVTNLWAGFLYYLPLLRLPEFALGVLLAQAFLLLKPQEATLLNQPSKAIPICIATIIGVFALFSFPHPIWTHVWTAPVSMVILGLFIMVVAFERLGGITKFLHLPFMILLGEASYSMYMMQRPVAGYLDQIFKRVGLGFIGESKVSFLIYLVVLTAFSILLFKKVEMPLRKSIRAKLSPLVHRGRQAASTSS